jgi:hypothetical protein
MKFMSADYRPIWKLKTFASGFFEGKTRGETHNTSLEGASAN